MIMIMWCSVSKHVFGLILFSSWFIISVRSHHNHNQNANANANANELLLPPSPCNFSSIYNFGDSNSDTGAMSAAFLPLILPYGQTTFRKPAGRHSDGLLTIDYITTRLGFPYLSAYLDSLGTSYKHGANFAVGGSTIGHVNETWFQTRMSPFPIDIQTLHFMQFTARTSHLYQTSKGTRRRVPKPNDHLNALYTFDIGQNDIAAALRTMDFHQILTKIPLMVNQLASAIQSIYEQGGRAFWIHNTGPYGCIPLTFGKPGDVDKIGCVKSHNDLAAEFNRQLKEKVVELRASLPNAALTYVDIYTAKYSLIANAKLYGFMDPKNVCCGIFEKDVNIWCGTKMNVGGVERYAASCENPSSYIFWDGIHYTEAANRWIANKIMNGSFSDPPISITNACHRV